MQPSGPDLTTTETRAPLMRLVERVRADLRRRPGATAFDGRARILAYLPFMIIAAWWILTSLSYFASWPIRYVQTNVGLVAALVLPTIAILVIVVVVSGRSRRLVVHAAPDRLPIPVIIGLIAGLLLLIPFAEFYSGFHLWEIGQALLNQGEAFRLASERIAEGRSARLVVLALQVVAAPFTMAALPFLALQWFERRRYGLLTIVAALVPISTSVLVGRDFHAVTAGILVACAWMISRVRRRHYFSWRDVVVVAAAGVVFVVLFVLRKLSRGSFAATCTPGSVECGQLDESSNAIDAVLRFFGTYATQSYEGLGRALNGTWSFGGGYSHSAALRGVIEPVFGVRPDPVITDQLERFDWSANERWSTGLAFIANDVPWVLVPVVVGLQVVLLVVLWRSAVREADWASVTLFAYSWLSMFFLMQNLQLAISGPIYLGYLLLLAFVAIRWMRRRILARRANATAAT